MGLNAAVPPLTISGIDLWAVRLPLYEPFIISYATAVDVPTIIVRLRTSDGLEGWGEATPDPNVTGETYGGTFETLRRDLLPALPGYDARDREAILAALDARVEEVPAAKAAVDIALHDLIGRASGLPVWALLGGRSKPHLEISRVVSMKSPSEMAADAVRHVEAGFKTIKLKVGDGDRYRRDAERIAAVRAAIGYDIGIKVDVNQGWHTPGVAIAAIRASIEQAPDYYEQPVAHWDIAGLADVRRQTGAIIMADEACHGPREMMRIAELRAADLVNIKLMKTGGLFRALQLNAIAVTAGIRAQVGTMVESSIASAAGLHLAMALGNVRTIEMGGPNMISHDIGNLKSYYSTNRIDLPDAPGLGIEIDEQALTHFAEAHIEIA
ncbi:MAG: mandelate racemase/muconate lactonizing enzyme family protein [Thermomicrobiales bacterium]